MNPVQQPVAALEAELGEWFVASKGYLLVLGRNKLHRGCYYPDRPESLGHNEGSTLCTIYLLRCDSGVQRISGCQASIHTLGGCEGPPPSGLRAITTLLADPQESSLRT